MKCGSSSLQLKLFVVLGVVVCLVLSSIAISIGVRKFADLSSGSIEPTVVFVDDGIASVRGIDSIVLNDSGQSGKHFEPLFMEFKRMERRSSRNISIDVVGADGMADSNDIEEAIKIAIEKDADLICIALAAVKHTEILRHQIELASMYGITVVAATQSGFEKIASYPASFGSVMGVYPLRSAKEEYWFSNGIGADLGVVVPPLVDHRLLRF